MKKITKEEFDGFPIIYGIKQCPQGDYSLFSSFAERCSFANGCSFAKGCKICSHFILDNFVRSVSGCGNGRRTLYAWNTKDGWFFQAGCRFASENDFLASVREKYGKKSGYENAMKLLKLL